MGYNNNVVSRVNVPAAEGSGLSAFLEGKPVPLAFLKTNEVRIRLIVSANKQNDGAVMFLI